MSSLPFVKSLAKYLAVCAAVLALWAEDSKGADAEKWHVIADAYKTWTDEKAYSAYAQGRFDLSKAKRMRMAFEPGQAGIKFWLRLVPDGKSPHQPVGVRWKLLSIPADGIVIVPLKAADFGLTPKEMGQLIQISVHSGNNAWNRPLEQDAGKRATFKEIAIQ